MIELNEIIAINMGSPELTGKADYLKKNFKKYINQTKKRLVILSNIHKQQKNSNQHVQMYDCARFGPCLCRL